MAEILLSLTIIGVVAAITLPSLTGNINERTWNTQRKALYARFSQAIALMPALNGYSNADTFVTAGLTKVLKINNICDNDHLTECGFASKYVKFSAETASLPRTMSELNPDIISVSYSDDGGSGSYSQTDTDAAAFETANGESLLVFYNPNCQSNMGETSRYFIQSKMCANFIYDLNGTKGPNTIGKDIGFISVFYPSDSVVAAPNIGLFYAGKANKADAISLCRKTDVNYRLPNREEIMAMFINKDILGFDSISNGEWTFWSSAVVDTMQSWYMVYTVGYLNNADEGREFGVSCVKR